MLEFDNDSTAVVTPDMFHPKIEGFPKTCVSFFSHKLIKLFVDTYKPEIVGYVKNTTIENPIYRTFVDGLDVIVVQAMVGAPACVANFEEIISRGVENIVLIGCCGCLKKELEDYSIIIPTAAIRDEGTSYHYAQPSEEIELDKGCVKAIENVIKSIGFKYSKGKTWTTDAIFRETKTKIEQRKAQGAITVDMECSAMAVVCKFRGVNFAQLFYAADNLGSETYELRSLGNSDMDKEAKMIPIGIKCAAALQKYAEKKKAKSEK